jgi:hypothetical protein
LGFWLWFLFIFGGSGGCFLFGFWAVLGLLLHLGRWCVVLVDCCRFYLIFSGFRLFFMFFGQFSVLLDLFCRFIAYIQHFINYCIFVFNRLWRLFFAPFLFPLKAGYLFGF